MGAGQPVFNQAFVASATPTLTGAVFSAADAVGGKLTFANVCPDGQNCGIIEAVTLIDKSDQKVVTDLILFSADFTPTADNDPFAVSDADLANYLCTLQFAVANYTDFGANAAAILQPLSIPFKLTAPATTLYGQLITRGTPTYVAGELTVRLHVRS